MAGFIDIACNFTHPSFGENLDQVIKEAKNVDVNKFVLLCASLKDLEPIEIAKELQKPLYLHQRDAHDDFISILKKNNSALPPFIVHCFTGTRKQLDDYLDLGAFIGLTGWICDEKRNRDLRESIKNIPLDKLMLETDCPYLVPKNLPIKAKKNINEPKYLPHIAKEVSELIGISIESLRDATSKNAENFFT